MPKNPTSESETSKVKRFETGATGGFGIARPTAAMPGGTTGRFLVLLREGATDEGVTSIEKRTGKKLTGATKVLSTLGIESEQRPEGILFESLGVAVVESSPEEIQGVMAEAAGEGKSHPARRAGALRVCAGCSDTGSCPTGRRAGASGTTLRHTFRLPPRLSRCRQSRSRPGN